VIRKLDQKNWVQPYGMKLRLMMMPSALERTEVLRDVRFIFVGFALRQWRL
jgi:hypothetical protein